ncbi:hypothetical protein EYC80_003808 [Monilinia laxa]|uniref:Uncharacterized protein n=1 Tax=Monilinia laxa TaxID=61186 RepID=A0A5N6KKV7_MONLA|nr:hypothetical protein EYC80_003808 [Monilinia laxa]
MNNIPHLSSLISHLSSLIASTIETAYTGITNIINININQKQNLNQIIISPLQSTNPQQTTSNPSYPHHPIIPSTLQKNPSSNPTKLGTPLFTLPISPKLYPYLYRFAGIKFNTYRHPYHSFNPNSKPNPL